jgi:hypothetical protein
LQVQARVEPGLDEDDLEEVVVPGQERAGEVAVGAEGGQAAAAGGRGRQPTVQQERLEDPWRFALIEWRTLKKVEVDLDAIERHAVVPRLRERVGRVLRVHLDERDFIPGDVLERQRFPDPVELRLCGDVDATQRHGRVAGVRRGAAAVVADGAHAVRKIKCQSENPPPRPGAVGPGDRYVVVGWRGHLTEVFERAGPSLDFAVPMRLQVHQQFCPVDRADGHALVGVGIERLAVVLQDAHTGIPGQPRHGEVIVVRPENRILIEDAVGLGQQDRELRESRRGEPTPGAFAATYPVTRLQVITKMTVLVVVTLSRSIESTSGIGGRPPSAPAWTTTFRKQRRRSG